MAKIVHLIFLVLLIATTASAADDKKEPSCTPRGGKCQVSENCCRHLVCPTYTLVCTLINGGYHDTRPIGPDPFPVNYVP